MFIQTNTVPDYLKLEVQKCVDLSLKVSKVLASVITSYNVFSNIQTKVVYKRL